MKNTYNNKTHKNINELINYSRLLIYNGDFLKTSFKIKKILRFVVKHR